MKNSPLKIIVVDKKENLPISEPFKTNRETIQAKFERLWHLDPEQFNPLRNCMEKERIDRIYHLISEEIDIKMKNIVDLGCGAGVLAIKLCEGGAHLDAVDIAKNALKELEKKHSNIRIIQDCVPHTRLEDCNYDLVICTDLISYLPQREYRLLFSELSRLTKKEGFVVCSTPLDIYSEDSLTRFASLAETELQIIKWVLSYHRLYILLRDWIEAPKRFAQAKKDKKYREAALAKRHAFAKWWFKVNSTPGLGDFWTAISFVLKPIASWIRQSRFCLLFLEKICRFFWADSGVSHAIFLAQKHPLIEAPKTIPMELKRKKTVWE